MSSSLSNTFGFNMGAKMGDFGIYEAIGGTPPTPQPKYVVLSINSSSAGGRYTFQEIVNTSNAGISSVDGLDIGGGQRAIVVSFAGDYAVSLNNVYFEGYFQNSWYYPSDDSTNYFQIAGSSSSQVYITPLTTSGSTGWVDGVFVLTMVIFEI